MSVLTVPMSIVPLGMGRTVIIGTVVTVSMVVPVTVGLGGYAQPVRIMTCAPYSP